MKNKEGFTLVELLAVIVILAVVILIAVTAVIPRMNKARENAFVDEALVYMKAAKEAYVTDPTTECYNIADMGDLVKQNKSGYTGTVYVNEKGTSINITNGKYYIKTNTQPNAYDLVTTKPDKFIDACSDTNKTYTISYDLGGGTVSTANPTSYNQNTPTITLNNPTKTGYRFVGWSSKNMFKPINDNNYSIINHQNRTISTIENGLYSVKATSNTNIDTSWMIISNYLFDNLQTGTYSVSMDARSKNCIYTVSFSRTLENVTNGKTGFRIDNTFIGGTSNDIVFDNDGIFHRTSGPISLQTNTGDIKFSLGVDWPNLYGDNCYVEVKNVQLEYGSTATDYQEYMDPTTNAKIYRGSTGNKKFIANWEAM